MSSIRHGPGPPFYHPSHGSGGSGQFERRTSSTDQRQHQPDVSQNPYARQDVERRSDVGFDGNVGDGSRADRVCGLRPSCVTPTQPHKRHNGTPTSFHRGTSYMGSRDPNGPMQFGYDDEGATGLARDKAASSVCTRTRDRVLLARCLMRVRDPYSV